MSDERKKPVRSLTRWFIRAAWYLHRAQGHRRPQGIMASQAQPLGHYASHDDGAS